MEDKEYRTVCFSPEKHSKCKSNYESSSPVKISKYQIKRNRITDEDEVHMNKRTKLEDPKDNEVSFDIKSLPKVEKDETVHDVEGLLIWQTNSLVNTRGRITFTAPQETNPRKRENPQEARGCVDGQHCVNSPCVMGRRYTKDHQWLHVRVKQRCNQDIPGCKICHFKCEVDD